MLLTVQIDASQFVKRCYNIARFTVNIQDFIWNKFVNSERNRNFYSLFYEQVTKLLIDFWATL